MKNNTPNNYLQENEIDLKETFKLLINSKKLIITITLVITILGAIYSFQKAPVFKSTALIEIGQYDTFEKKNILLESASKLIQNLNIAFIYKSVDNYYLSTKTIENKLIKIEILTPSIEQGIKTLDEIIRHIENRHTNLLSNIQQRITNPITYKIESLNNQIEFSQSRTSNLTERLNNNIEAAKYIISNLIESLNSELPGLNRKIESLNLIIVKDEGNLSLLKANPPELLQRTTLSPTLEQVIHSYEIQLLDYEDRKIQLLKEKDVLQNQLNILESNNLETAQIFKLLIFLDTHLLMFNKLTESINLESERTFQLSQEKNRLEKELELLINQKYTNSQLIGELDTNVVDKKVLIIFLSFIIGLFLSILIFFINNSLKALKEE